MLVERRDQGCWLALQWLHRLAVARGRTPDQRRWSMELFWEGPSVDRWKAVREGTREVDRRRMRDQLRKDGKYHLLVRILLSEGQHKAVEARNLLRLADPDDVETIRLSADVAEALADRKPRDAARLWRVEADRLCRHGHAGTYNEAVDLIMKGRELRLPRLRRQSRYAASRSGLDINFSSNSIGLRYPIDECILWTL
jgi:hypothetical protein